MTTMRALAAGIAAATLSATALQATELNIVHGAVGKDQEVLRAALDDLLRKFGVHPDPEHPDPDDVVVAVFPKRMPLAEVTRRLHTSLDL